MYLRRMTPDKAWFMAGALAANSYLLPSKILYRWKALETSYKESGIGVQ